MSQMRKPPKAEIAGFPMMTTAEVCDCLAALGINVHPDDILKPTGQSTQMIYAGLLESLMGAPMEQLEQPKSALLGMMEYKDLYGDALHFTMFFRHCRELANLCGISNFNMSDLTRPDTQRLRTSLSGIMNFAKFRDERSGFQIELQQKVDQQGEKCEKLKRQLEKIETAISEIKAKSAADKPLTEAAHSRNENIRQELLDLRSEQVKLSHEVEELKTERQSVMDYASNKNKELSDLTRELASSRSRLVQSPDRIKRHISEMSLTVANERATHASYVRKGRELGNRLEVIGGLEMELKGLIDLEKGIEMERGRVEEAKRSMQTLQAKIDNKKIESKGMDARLEQLHRQLQNAGDKLARQQEMGKDMRERAKTKVEMLKVEYMVRSKERGTIQRERDVLIQEQKALEAEMATFVTKNEQEINDLLQEYWTMRKQAEDYMNTMSVKLGLFTRV